MMCLLIRLSPDAAALWSTMFPDGLLGLRRHLRKGRQVDSLHHPNQTEKYQALKYRSSIQPAEGRADGRTTQRRRVTTRRGRAREYNGAQPMERGLQFVTTRPSGRLHPSTLVVVVVVPFQLFPHLKRLRLFPSDSCPVQRRSASQPVSLLP